MNHLSQHLKLQWISNSTITEAVMFVSTHSFWKKVNKDRTDSWFSKDVYHHPRLCPQPLRLYLKRGAVGYYLTNVWLCGCHGATTSHVPAKCFHGPNWRSIPIYAQQRSKAIGKIKNISLVTIIFLPRVSKEKNGREREKKTFISQD